MSIQPVQSALPLPTDAFNQNFNWVVRHYETLSDQYPNCWVAVDKGQVLAAGPDLAEVRRAAAGLARHDELVVHFVDDGSLIFA